jgi:hypothetical protein
MAFATNNGFSAFNRQQQGPAQQQQQPKGGGDFAAYSPQGRQPEQALQEYAPQPKFNPGNYANMANDQRPPPFEQKMNTKFGEMEPSKFYDQRHNFVNGVMDKHAQAARGGGVYGDGQSPPAGPPVYNPSQMWQDAGKQQPSGPPDPRRDLAERFRPKPGNMPAFDTIDPRADAIRGMAPQQPAWPPSSPAQYPMPGGWDEGRQITQAQIDAANRQWADSQPKQPLPPKVWNDRTQRFEYATPPQQQQPQPYRPDPHVQPFVQPRADDITWNSMPPVATWEPTRQRPAGARRSLSRNSR